jgi:hypothetical protein
MVLDERDALFAGNSWMTLKIVQWSLISAGFSDGPETQCLRLLCWLWASRLNLLTRRRPCGHGKAAPRSNHQYRPELLTDLVDRAKAVEIKNLRARALQQARRSLLERVMAFSNGNQAKMEKWPRVTQCVLIVKPSLVSQFELQLHYIEREQPASSEIRT